MQTTNELVQLAGFSFSVYASEGLEARAGKIAVQSEKAYRFLRDTLSAGAQFRLMVLAPQDWGRYTPYPLYGMPHYVDPQTLIIAGENNDFWRSLTPPIEALPPKLAEAARSAYGQADGTFDLSAFFDLLAIHEMAHMFHVEAGLEFPRLWLMEVFVNVALHSFVASVMPEKLLALETLPQIVVSGDNTQLPYHNLADFERVYNRMDGRNYGWYQSNFHVAAAKIYNAGGVEALQRMWNAFLKDNAAPNDAILADRLHDEVEPEAARVLTEWGR